MSLDIIQTISSPTRKRSRETIALPSDDGASKCAEIFVTNNADKWTFYCSYCHKTTGDIGVFICHIKLEHLKPQTVTMLGEPTAELTGNANTAINNSPRNVMGNNGAEELTTTLQETLKQTDIVKKEVTIASNREIEKQISFESTNKEISQDVYIKQEAQDKAEEYAFNTNIINNDNIESQANANGNDTDSSYSAHEADDTDFDLHEPDNEATGSSSKSKRMQKSKFPAMDIDASIFYCPYCTVVFKSKQSATRHLLHSHDKKLPIRCEQCHRGFLTASGLKVHLKSHDDKNHFQCPVCKTKHIENYFITHVLTHESATCFPCQVCGKLYDSLEERMKHWKTHAKEKPFACTICYRRYAKLHYLSRHLKCHNQYHCNFCPCEFSSAEVQQPPYVCTKCEKLPDIKQRVEYVKSLADGNPVFDGEEYNFEIAYPVEAVLTEEAFVKDDDDDDES